MSLSRYFIKDLSRPSNIFDQNFGFGVFDDDLYPGAASFYPYARSLCPVIRNLTVPCYGKDAGFKVNLDVQQFKPDEITVKHEGSQITVEGRHEEKPDEHGYISRHFVRRYVLPTDVDVEQVKCQLSSDGILCVCAPKKVVAGSKGNERVIQINQTNVPAVKPASAAPASVAKPKK